MQPLIKWVGGFRFSSADNEFREELNGINFHDIKPDRCVV
jgi:hypothetical protein